MHHFTGSGGGGSPQQFCLRWNNYQSNLTNVFDQLLQSESFVDVTLACEGHSVKAHKMVLSACSPYFQTLFFDNPCRHPIVILKDVKWSELKAVVEFMYKGEINVSQEQIGPLLKVAESLKIRGLADVNNEHDLETKTTSGDTDTSSHVSMSPHRSTPNAKKRRLESVDPPSPSEDLPEALELVTTSPPTPQGMCPPPQTPTPSTPQPPPVGVVPPSSSMISLPLPPPPPPLPPPTSTDDMEIKPGIAEMIREEERAKMLESSHSSWLGASTSSLAADSYQYQLQSMWQKCWNTNQSLVHNLRFRERGPLKSWRPETMAEAILSVLKEGLSLSQAARKYDIPYPTFVLYANRVHNMLGPSADGGTDLRPKGRGRPQRILLGIWPEEHIHGVIRAVVFRDPQHVKEEALNLGYHRLSEPMYGSPSGCTESSGGVSPSSAAAAAVAAVAQGLRQQMLAAAHHHGNADHHFNFLSAHCGNGTGLGIHSPLPSPVDSSPRSSPLSAAISANNNLEVGLGYKQLNDTLGLGRSEHLFQDEIEDLVTRPKPSETPKLNKSLSMLAQQGAMLHNSGISPLSMYKSPTSMTHPMIRPEQLFQDEIEDLVKRPQSAETPKAPQSSPTPPHSQSSAYIHSAGVTPIYKNPNSQNHGSLSLVRAEHLFKDEIEDLVKRPPLQPMDTTQKVKVGIGMTYKPTNDAYSTSRSDALFQDDIDDLVKSPQSTNNQKEPALPLQVDHRID